VNRLHSVSDGWKRLIGAVSARGECAYNTLTASAPEGWHCPVVIAQDWGVQHVVVRVLTVKTTVEVEDLDSGLNMIVIECVRVFRLGLGLIDKLA